MTQGGDGDEPHRACTDHRNGVAVRDLRPECGVDTAGDRLHQDGEVIAKAEGWNADEWRAVTESIAEFTHWSRPPMPADGDPGTYSGTPISA